MKIIETITMTPEQIKDYCTRLAQLNKEKRRIMAPVYRWGAITGVLALAAALTTSFFLVPYLLISAMGLSAAKLIDNLVITNREEWDSLNEIDEEIQKLKSSKRR